MSSGTDPVKRQRVSRDNENEGRRGEKSMAYTVRLEEAELVYKLGRGALTQLCAWQRCKNWKKKMMRAIHTLWVQVPIMLGSIMDQLRLALDTIKVVWF